MNRFHARLFGLLAPIYGRWWKPVVLGLLSGGGFEEERATLLELHGPPTAGPTLDVGCGPGTFTVEFAALLAPALVVGVDVAQPMLRQARTAARSARHQNLGWVGGDAEALPVGRQRVSLVVCCGVLHLLPHPDAALRQIADALGPNGVLLGMTLVEGESAAQRALAAVLSSVLRFHFFARARLEALLGEAGLRLETSRRARLMLVFRARKEEREAIVR
jgi:ubiquinone/menaquinone biosynthesis C-methylase UbiE